MKRILLMLGLLGAFGATAAAAQTHVSVSIGFGAPAPYVSYYPRHYHQPYITYYPRPFYYPRALLYRPTRVVVVRRHPRRHHGHW